MPHAPQSFCILTCYRYAVPPESITEGRQQYEISQLSGVRLLVFQASMLSQKISSGSVHVRACQAWVHGEHASDHGTARSSRSGEQTNGRFKEQCHGHRVFLQARKYNMPVIEELRRERETSSSPSVLLCTAQVEQYKKKFDFFDEETVRASSLLQGFAEEVVAQGEHGANLARRRTFPSILLFSPTSSIDTGQTLQGISQTILTIMLPLL